MQVKPHFDESKFGLMKSPPDDNLWIALVIAGRNAIIRNTAMVTGPFLSKIRELEALGFNAALVSKFNATR